MPESRLNKFIADSGFCARRKADMLIAEGRVRVNGQIVTTLGTKIDTANDAVTIDHQPLPSRKHTYLAFHKPVGFVTSRQGGKRQKTIYELIPAEYQAADPAGRLDQDSSGLLILSSDGDFLHRITHPRFHWPKVYAVSLDRSLERQHLERLKQGIRLLPEDKLAKTEDVQAVSADSRHIRITLVTGYNRQIRRSLKILGYEVQTLTRMSLGPVQLSDLPPGAIRPLSAGEIKALSTTAPQPEQRQKTEQKKDGAVKNHRQHDGKRQTQSKG